MGKLQLRPCALLGWAYCNGNCNGCQTTVTTTHTPYDSIEIAKKYAPKFDKPVVDMVEVVRCKECRMHTYWNKELHEVFCEAYEGVKSENGYCDWGERKESEKVRSITAVVNGEEMTFDNEKDLWECLGVRKETGE